MEGEDKIRKIIKENVKIESASKMFSDDVMDKILKADALNEKVLSSVFEKFSLENAPSGFSEGVMSSINASIKTTSYEPVISKKAWFVILGTILITLIWSVVNYDSQEVGSISLLNHLKDFQPSFSMNDFSIKIPSILNSTIFALSIFCIHLLLLFDKAVLKSKWY